MIADPQLSIREIKYINEMTSLITHPLKLGQCWRNPIVTVGSATLLSPNKVVMCHRGYVSNIILFFKEHVLPSSYRGLYLQEPL